MPTTDNVVSLTFDCGGSAMGVDPILTTLADAGVPATFFLTGRWLEVYPDEGARIAAAHRVGNHSYSHPRFTTLTDDEIRRQVRRTERLIVEVTGRDPKPWFRFPYGDRDAHAISMVNSLGYGGIRWTVDTLGWMGKWGGQSVTSVVQRVLGAAQPGMIVLMHVGSAEDGTILDARALPIVIAELRARGYRFVRLHV